MAPLPRVSIIIVTWNALPLLKTCLPSVVETQYANLEIILADNASSDGSLEWVRQQFPHITIVRHPENWAFARGNNAALSSATGSYIVFLNNDVKVTAGWLAPLVERMERFPHVAAIQPKLLQYSDHLRFEYAGGSGGFIDKYGYPFTRGRLFHTLEYDRGQYDDAREIFWATGAALLVRRSTFSAVGGFDEHFVMHMEEIDLCWRFHRNGYMVMVEPRSHVYHIGGASLPAGDARKTYYNYRNSLLMLYKNHSPTRWRRILAGRLLFDSLAYIRAVLTGRWRESRAILSAFCDAHKMRKLYQSSRPTDADNFSPVFRRSIIVQYFVMRRLFFDDLPKHLFS